MTSRQFTIDWNRCVHVTGRMGDDVVDRLTPEILRLRQAGNEPITVAINSYGGSVSTIDALLDLISGPDQQGRKCSAITVVTHQALSAAASLLAFGTYAVALPHSSILFHDVRFGGMEDVTPDKAKLAARQLQLVNEDFALRMAPLVFRRLVWEYIDVRGHFKDLRQDEAFLRFKPIVEICGVAPTKTVKVDIAGFGAWIYRHLSDSNRQVLDLAFHQLQRWAATMTAARYVPMYSTEGTPGLLDGALKLFNDLKHPSPDAPPFEKEGLDAELRLFIVRLMAQLTGEGSTETHLEAAVGDLALLKSINDPSHMDTVSKLMLRHKSAFFTPEGQDVLDGEDAAAKTVIMDEVRPYVGVMWHFCVLLCRCLINGDHRMTPREALVLGIVDEVPGDDTVESRRAFRVKNEERERRGKEKAAATEVGKQKPRRLPPSKWRRTI